MASRVQRGHWHKHPAKPLCLSQGAQAEQCALCTGVEACPVLQRYGDVNRGFGSNSAECQQDGKEGAAAQKGFAFSPSPFSSLPHYRAEFHTELLSSGEDYFFLVCSGSDPH